MNRKRDQAYRGKISTPLDSLFGEEQIGKDKTLAPVALIRLPKQQPRRYFDPQKMEQLILSIKEHGILEPLLVRPLDESTYELVAGERRYRAAKALNLDEVPVVIRNLTSSEALQIALIENLQREDLNPIEETEGILQLLSLDLEIDIAEVPPILYRMANEAKGNVNRNVTVNPEEELVKQVFTKLGLMKWESFVRNRLPLLNLPPDIIESLRQGKIAYTKALAIASVKNSKDRQQLLTEAITENLSLAEIRERISDLKPQPDTNSPRLLFKEITSRITKSKSLWNDPKKLKKVTTLINQLSALIED